MHSDTAERVRALVAPIVSDHGLSLYDVEHTGGSLRVLVDREGGADIDALGRLTHAVSEALDRADPVPGRYTLEVSSPGLERRLRRPEHFVGAMGETVSVKTVPGVGGDRRVQGTLVEVTGDGVVVETDDGARHLAFDDVEAARTVFTWEPEAKPGKGKKRAGKQTAPGSGAPTRKATNR